MATKSTLFMATSNPLLILSWLKQIIVDVLSPSALTSVWHINVICLMN